MTSAWASPLSISRSIPIQRPTSATTPSTSTCHLVVPTPKPPNPIKVASLNLNSTKLGVINKDGILFLRLWGEPNKRENRVVKLRFRRDNNNDGFTSSSRVLGNLALAVGLTYLTMTDQLAGLLDTIVSLWLLAFIVPVVAIGAFLWWAGRDMIEATCPNCGNAFQVFKSSLNDELQLCPFCSQPFSVEGNEFVNEPIKFSSKRSAPFGQTFGDFSPWSKKGKDISTTIVDVEAEVKDAD